MQTCSGARTRFRYGQQLFVRRPRRTSGPLKIARGSGGAAGKKGGGWKKRQRVPLVDCALDVTTSQALQPNESKQDTSSKQQLPHQQLPAQAVAHTPDAARAHGNDTEAARLNVDKKQRLDQTSSSMDPASIEERRRDCRHPNATSFRAQAKTVQQHRGSHRRLQP